VEPNKAAMISLIDGSSTTTLKGRLENASGVSKGTLSELGKLIMGGEFIDKVTDDLDR
jgi:hypothetical protein